VIGFGASGKVYKTHNLFDQNMKVAIKVIDKEKLKDFVDNIIDEIQLLSTLDHPNIINYIEVYNDLKYLYLVTELAEG